MPSATARRRRRGVRSGSWSSSVESAIVSSNTGVRRTIGVSQNGHTCQSGSSGCLAGDARLLELRRADRADQELGLDRRAAHRAVRLAPGRALLHRANLELALADVLEVLRRTEEEVDQRPEERRHQTEERSPSRPATDPSIRRRASLYTQYALASQKTTTKKIARFRITSHVPEWKKSFDAVEQTAVAGGGRRVGCEQDGFMA